MASLIIRKLDDRVKARLRLRAARHGRSMEEEAREILKMGVGVDRAPGLNLAESIRRHMSAVGAVKLDLPRREPIRRRPSFDR